MEFLYYVLSLVSPIFALISTNYNSKRWRYNVASLKHVQFSPKSLRWRHNGRDIVSNHQPCDCLLNRLFRRRSKKTSKLRVTGFCVGNSRGTGQFPAQMASYAGNVSIWWRHHILTTATPVRATYWMSFVSLILEALFTNMDKLKFQHG